MAREALSFETSTEAQSRDGHCDLEEYNKFISRVPLWATSR